MILMKTFGKTAFFMSLEAIHSVCERGKLQTCDSIIQKIKSNHFYCHITTAQVPWWVKFLWACSRQCKKQQTIYIWTDSAKNNRHLHADSAKKLHSIYMLQTVQKNNNSIYIWTDSAKKQQQFTYGQYIFTDCTEDNVQNTHTYTQYT